MYRFPLSLSVVAALRIVVSASSSKAGTIEEAEGVLAFRRLVGLVGVMVCEDLSGLRIDLPGMAVCELVPGRSKGTKGEL